MQNMKKKVTDNKQEQRYELPVEGYICYIDYMKPEEGVVCLTHTEIPFAIQNKGYGNELVEAVLTEIEQEGAKVVPLCGFVASYIEKHPQWMVLVADGIEEV